MSVEQRREWGVLVERAVARDLGVEHVDDDTAEWHDLRTGDDLLVLDVDGPVGVLRAGEPGEVKTAARRICKDSTPRPGRWHITRENHEQLLVDGGWYALTVYDEAAADLDAGVDGAATALEAVAVVPAETVDYLVDSWRESTHGYDYTQLAWSSTFDDLDIKVDDAEPSLKCAPGETTDGAATTRSKSNEGDRTHPAKVGRSPSPKTHE